MSLTKTKTCEKKMKIAETKVLKILSKLDTLKLNDSNIARLEVDIKKVRANFMAGYLKYRLLVPVAISALIYSSWWIYTQLLTQNCLISLPSSSKALFRPPEDCSMCIGIDDVTRLSNISAQDFEELYAYNTVPVIVTDATKDWKAIKKSTIQSLAGTGIAGLALSGLVYDSAVYRNLVLKSLTSRPLNKSLQVWMLNPQEFNFNFFRDFYRRGSLGRQTGDCSFFAYNSGLRSLSEVFSMDERRANLSGDPWYVGWSTCLDGETRALREYYSRPYFLPRAAESDATDWLFMGGPGQGAHMHVDSVRHVSWQAQVRGHKSWQLAPPPECLYQCRWITFTVNPGEILVVDTNRWYHRTTVLPGDISITIGAEYD